MLWGEAWWELNHRTCERLHIARTRYPIPNTQYTIHNTAHQPRRTLAQLQSTACGVVQGQRQVAVAAPAAAWVEGPHCSITPLAVGGASVIASGSIPGRGGRVGGRVGRRVAVGCPGWVKRCGEVARTRLPSAVAVQPPPVTLASHPPWLELLADSAPEVERRLSCRQGGAGGGSISLTIDCQICPASPTSKAPALALSSLPALFGCSCITVP